MSALKNQTELSGMLGESLSVRKVNGRVVVKNRPQRKVVTLTPRQLEYQDKFGDASIYANGQMSDDAAKALYAAAVTGKRQSAYTLAVRDFLVAPKVKEIDRKKYQGSIGDPIAVRAKDDFMVTKVEVVISGVSGEIIEKGEAIQDPKNLLNWIYTSTVANPALPGTKITANAFDRPGNIGTLEIVL